MTDDKPKTGTENSIEPTEGDINRNIPMHGKLLKIRDLRWEITAGKEVKAKLYTELEEEHKEFLDNLTQQEKELKLAEGELKALAVSQFNATGNKKLYGGVSVKLYDKLDYLDEDALKWAKNTNMALMLNVKAFKAIAKATPIDCVTITKEPRATIPTKIQLKEENVPKG